MSYRMNNIKHCSNMSKMKEYLMKYNQITKFLQLKNKTIQIQTNPHQTRLETTKLSMKKTKASVSLPIQHGVEKRILERNQRPRVDR